MRLRLVKVQDDLQLLTCIQHGLWASKTKRFKNWRIEDYIGIVVDKEVAALGRVSGDAFHSKEPIWEDALYPNRVPIEFIWAMHRGHRLQVLGEVRDALLSRTEGWSWGWMVMNQKLLEGDVAEVVVNSVKECKNDLRGILTGLDELLLEAMNQRERRHREDAAKQNRRRRKQGVEEPDKRNEAPREPGSETTDGTAEESEHSRFQRALVDIGLCVDCSVWIANNDRGRTYDGTPLGRDCIDELPGLGLGGEAMRRIRLIDVLWLRQNAPICAFELETTTSVYSGLLRMSDLLSVVPAIKIQLYIVAPKDRERKVMAELGRPTFQKIGLSDYCRFIPSEELCELLSKTQDLQGYLKPDVIESIAKEWTEDVS